MRGRKPKTTAEKRLAGNPGKRPLNEQEPHMPPLAEPPEQVPVELLDDACAAAEWRRLDGIMRQARSITEGDRAALVSLCQQWSRYQEAHATVAKAGMVVRAPSGFPIMNPYIAIANKALGHCVKLWAELGLTPTSRSRVVAVPDPKSSRWSFAEFEHPVSNGMRGNRLK